jgi:hypothetical protein
VVEDSPLHVAFVEVHHHGLHFIVLALGDDLVLEYDHGEGLVLPLILEQRASFEQ